MKLLSTIFAMIAATMVLASVWAFGGVRFWAQLAVGASLLISVSILAISICIGRYDETKCTWHVWPVLLAIFLGCFQAARMPTEWARWISPSTVDLVESLGAFEAVQSDSMFATLSVAPESTRVAAAQLAMVLAAYLIGTMVFSTGVRFRFLLLAVVINGIALSLFGILQYLTWNGSIYWRFPVESAGVFASFVNRNNAGGYLCLCFGAAIALYLGQDESAMMIWNPGQRAPFQERFRMLIGGLIDQFSDWKRLILLIGLMVVGSGIVVTLSRGACLAFLAGTLAVSFTASKHGRRLFFVMGGTAVAMILGLAAYLGRLDSIWQRFAFGLLENSKSGMRPQHWAESIQMFADHPFLGTGLGTYGWISPMYQQCLNDAWFQHAENQFLEAFVEGGILGGALLLVSLGFVVVATLRLRSGIGGRQDIEALALGWFTLVSQMVSSFFDFGLYLPANALLFALLCGSIVGRSLVNRPAGLRIRFTFVAAVFVTALACFETWSMVQAESVLSHSLDSLSQPDEASSRPAESELRLGDIERALRMRPGDSKLHRAKGEALISQFRRATVADLGMNDQAVTEGLWRRTDPVELFNRMVAWQLTDDPALEQMREQQLVKDYLLPAFEAFLDSRRCCPLARGVHFRLAELRPLADGDPRSDIERALRLAPASSFAAIKSGYMLMQLGHLEAGIQSLEMAIELNVNSLPFVIEPISKLDAEARFRILPQDPEVLIDVIDEECWQPEKAVARRLLFEHVFALIDKEELDILPAVRSYAEGRYAESRDRLEEAREAVGKGLLLEPHRAKWRYRFALIYEKLREYDQAIREIDRSLKSNPQHPLWLSARRRLLLKNTPSQ